MTLYELLSLRQALSGRDRAQLLSMLAEKEPTRIRELNPAVPRDLETIVHKAMAKEPEERYATSRELADDLQRFLLDRPILAKPPTLLERSAKWARRHRGIVTGAARVLVLAVVGLASATLLIARERADALRQRNQARHERQRADERFRLAFQAVEQLHELIGNDAFRSVGGQERTLKMQEASKQQMVRYSYELIKAYTSDQDVAPEVAISHYRLYRLVAEVEHDREKADLSLLRALAMWEQIARRNPHDPKTLGSLAFTLIRAAELHARKGHPQIAEDCFRRSLATFDSVARDFPAHVEDWAEIATLAESYRHFMTNAPGRAGEAEGLDHRVLGWFDRLESARGWLDYSSEKVRVLTIWTHLAMRCGQPKKAMVALEKARGFLVTDLDHHYYAGAAFALSNQLANSADQELADPRLGIVLSGLAVLALPEDTRLACLLAGAQIKERNWQGVRTSLAKVAKPVKSDRAFANEFAWQLFVHLKAEAEAMVREAAAAIVEKNQRPAEVEAKVPSQFRSDFRESAIDLDLK